MEGRSGLILVAWILAGLPLVLAGAEPVSEAKSSLRLIRQPGQGHLILVWTGAGRLHGMAEGSPVTTAFHQSGQMTIMPKGEYGVYWMERDGASVQEYRRQAVGYLNVSFPKGLSLISNPFLNASNGVADVFEPLEDGLQVMKYGADGRYEVSTYDGIAKAWSNPKLDISPGIGIFVRNSTGRGLVMTLVGYLPEGDLVSLLPQGYSMKGSLSFKQGSINTVHHVAGMDGDEIRVLVNTDGSANYVSSMFKADVNAWVPDLELQRGQGFWIHKQAAQEWKQSFKLNL